MWAMGLARGTVRKYACAESFPARLPYGPGPSILDPYLPHLERRLAEGCENALALWRELRAQGFPGGFPGGNKQVHRWLAEHRLPSNVRYYSLAAFAEPMVFGALIVFFLIKEPHGLARLWAIGKQKLRLWPFPH